MALATTQAVWRSGGGDQTRTAYCGSMVMAAQYYIADASSSGNVQISATNTNPVILPAGAVILGITINDAGTGHIDMGYTTPSGVVETNTILSNQSVAAVTALATGATAGGVDFGTVMQASQLTTITYAKNSDGAGTVGGVITYYVADDGQQNV